MLGSRGSVIPTFVRQIEAGGPVTVTDPRMTRFFMSIPEAVQLVLQAAAMSEGGEIFMLEMGEPVRIIDLAKRMIRLCGRRVGADVEIRVTGIRAGREARGGAALRDELPEPTAHPSVVRLSPVVPDVATLRAGVLRLSDLSAGMSRPAVACELLRPGHGPGDPVPRPGPGPVAR